MKPSLLLLLACTGCARDLSTDNFNKPFEQWVPGDVRAFVIDAQACTHFTGEEGYDRRRRAFLEKMIRETCTNIDERGRLLWKRYASPQIRQVISSAWE